jgi:hypothetical protein
VTTIRASRAAGVDSSSTEHGGGAAGVGDRPFHPSGVSISASSTASMNAGDGAALAVNDVWKRAKAPFAPCRQQ